MDAKQRKSIAKDLFCKLGLTHQEIGGLLKVSAQSILRYAKEDQKKGQDWEQAKSFAHLGPEHQSRRFRKCLSLILSQAEEALQGLAENRDLAPEKRAQLVTALMETLHKATNTAKKLDPELNLELVIAEVLRIVNQCVLDLAPNLAVEWLQATYAIEERIQQEKEKWQ